MLYIFFCIILTSILIQLKQASSQECSGKSSTSSTLSFHSCGSFINLKSVVDAKETYANVDQCNFTLAAPKMIINPYKCMLENFVEFKPFNTMYLKCVACLAVAEQISQTIIKSLAETESNSKKQDFINAELSDKLQSLCQNGFKNYDLRKYNETTLLTDRLKCTEHVNSKMDGSWTKKLRDMCNLYTSYMDMKHISNNYKTKTNNLATDLCSGSGIFRDCQNLDSGDFVENIQELEFCEVCECGK